MLYAICTIFVPKFCELLRIVFVPNKCYHKLTNNEAQEVKHMINYKDKNGKVYTEEKLFEIYGTYCMIGIDHGETFGEWVCELVTLEVLVMC